MDIGGSLSISDSKTYEQLPRNEARVRVARDSVVAVLVLDGFWVGSFSVPSKH